MSFLQIIYDGQLHEEVPEQKQVPLTLSILDNQEETTESLSISSVTALPQITKSEFIAEKNEDTSGSNANTAAEWNDRETKYLLKKYNKYIMLTGRSKKIRTKRELWLHIARDMKNDLKAPKSAAQCENRYKTLLRRWRRRKIIEQETQTADTVIDANDQNETSTSALNESKREPLKTVLLEIFKQKEENRERRHREKMQLIKTLIENM